MGKLIHNKSFTGEVSSFTPYLSFDGVDDYVSIGSSFPSTRYIEWELTDTGIDGEGFAFGKWTSTYVFYHFILVYSLANDEWVFSINGRNNSSNYRYYNGIFTKSQLLGIDGVRFRFDTSNEEIFVNGNSLGTLNLYNSSGSDVDFNSIGGNLQIYRSYVNGDTRYRGGIGNYFALRDASNNLFSEYLFNEGQGTILNDNVGNNDGTIVGATWGQS